MKSFISKKKDKAQDIVKLSKNEIVIPNVNMAELDKRFAMAEMNNSLLKKNKNIHQTDISCSDNQSIVFTDDDIEIDVEIDTCEKMVSNLNTNKKEVMLENVKNKIKNLIHSSKPPKEIIKENSVSPRSLDESDNILKKISNIGVSSSKSSFLPEPRVGEKISLLEPRNEIKDSMKHFNKIKKEFDIKNVVSKLETIGISEHKSYNYNTLIKNESIICNSYNSICNLDSLSASPHSGEICLNSLSCWWCRHPIPENLLPIGCPIKYHKSVGSSREYFDTEGFFCSFNCVVAYNNDVCQTNIRYRETGGLIYLLYKKIFDHYPYQMNIKPALSWKVLKSYGGEMSIHEYRNTFQKVENVSENVIKNKSLLLSSSTIFIEEKSNIKLSQSEF